MNRPFAEPHGAPYASEQGAPPDSQTTDAPGDKTKFLLEMVVCDLYWAAMQVGAITILSSAAIVSGARAPLKACRYLLHDDVNAMLLALRFGEELGLRVDAVAKLNQLYGELSLAQKALLPLTEFSALTRAHQNQLQNQNLRWRRIASDTSGAIGLVEPRARACLAPQYVADAEILIKYLKRAADGVVSDIDSSGILHPPSLTQRRKSPRKAAETECMLVVADRSFRAKVEDASREGLGLVCAHPLDNRQKLVVALADGRRLEAMVVRRNGSRTGVKLRQQLRSNDPLLIASAAK